MDRLPMTAETKWAVVVRGKDGWFSLRARYSSYDEARQALRWVRGTEMEAGVKAESEIAALGILPLPLTKFFGG